MPDTPKQPAELLIAMIAVWIGCAYLQGWGWIALVRLELRSRAELERHRRLILRNYAVVFLFLVAVMLFTNFWPGIVWLVGMLTGAMLAFCAGVVMHIRRALGKLPPKGGTSDQDTQNNAPSPLR
jgi:sugar phosphate permease